MPIKKFPTVSSIAASAPIILNGDGFLPSKHFGILATPSVDFAGTYEIQVSTDKGATWQTAVDGAGNDMTDNTAATKLYDNEGQPGERLRVNVSAYTAGSLDVALIS